MPTIVLDDGRVARWSKTVADGNWWAAEVDGAIAGNQLSYPPQVLVRLKNRSGHRPVSSAVPRRTVPKPVWGVLPTQNGR